MDIYQDATPLSFEVEREIDSVISDEKFTPNSFIAHSKVIADIHRLGSPDEGDFEFDAEFESGLDSWAALDVGSFYNSELFKESKIDLKDTTEAKYKPLEVNPSQEQIEKENNGLERDKKTSEGPASESFEKQSEQKLQDKRDDENTPPARKTRNCRHIEPSEFLSLKRKDVVMKSIFRMMRRYFCKLMEDVSGYDRKEKQLKVKHAKLIESVKAGVVSLGFSDFSNNMAFYFSVFAYSSDMRKILEEAKHKYRSQNEVIHKALYIVDLVENCFNRYSKKVMLDLLSVPEFAFLIRHYLSKVDDLSEYPVQFQNCYKILMDNKTPKSTCSSSPSSSGSKSSVFALKEDFFLFELSDSSH